MSARQAQGLLADAAQVLTRLRAARARRGGSAPGLRAALRAGDVFVACAGRCAGDGRAFIAQALAQGASAVIFEAEGADPSAASDKAMPVRGLRAMLGARSATTGTASPRPC